MATNGQFYWPSVGSSVAAYGQGSLAWPLGIQQSKSISRIDPTRSNFAYVSRNRAVNADPN
jgi:hypothetical protein